MNTCGRNFSWLIRLPYWYQKNKIYVLCGNATGSVKCPYGYVCWKDRGMNPDFGYTSFDNYGWAMLSCFRLMTQDYWESLYLLVLSASGRYHFLYFLAIIFFGSFYLINLILAIVSMSYLGQQTLVEAENEERERRKIQDDIELENEEVQKVLEAQASLHAENSLVYEDANCKISYSGISIECEQNDTKHESNNIGSLQASPSMFQFDKSSLILPYLTANGATRIPFFDETQQNTPNEDRKSQQANSISYFPEISLNDSDLVITLYQDKSSMVCTPMNELLTVPELDRISVRSKNVKATKTDDGAVVKFLRTFCWECSCKSTIFKKFQTAVAFFVLDAFVDLFITICIILNTVLMAIDHHGQSEKTTRILMAGNYIFTSIFTAESILKIIAMTPVNFLKSGWNVFDLLLVSVSLIELGLANVKGLSVLRSFRLLRVFKLAKSWQTLNRLMSIIGKSIGALGNLTVVLVIII
ncbi:unnamed protein product, partial [Rotaria magnacalcarata]